MKPGEQFEKDCFEYLKSHFKTEYVDFVHMGGMDSTKSDIVTLKNGKELFYIEAKDSQAQSGQFVLLPEKDKKIFVFSPHNRSTENEMTRIITEHMNANFDHFANAGTSGQVLNVDVDVFSNWIIQHYKSKNVKYVISRNDGEYVIFPIRKFAEYFDIKSNYRIKKSGSGRPANKDIHDIEKLICQTYPTAEFSRENKKLFVYISKEIQEDRFTMGNYTYYLSRQGLNKYEVRKLSNTNNMNVIFSVELVKGQNKIDLEEFEFDISSQNLT